MQWSGFYFASVALCCIHVASEPLRYHEDYRANGVRRRRSEERDGLALSREIFRNITKQLRENIEREAASDKTNRSFQNKLEDSRHTSYGAYQSSHHHERHWGPYFEGEGAEGATQVTAHVGAEALLNCRVGMLKDKTVMWLRRHADSAELLTVARDPHAGDNRIAVKFQYPNNWRLSINPVRKADAGLYMCQISTHPPRFISANLTVLPPILTINGDETHEVKDRFYKSGSSINLACIISEDYITALPSKPTTTTRPTTTQPTSTTTELTTKMSTVFNRIDLVMNKSWSVETTTLTSTVSISTTTKIEPKSLTTLAPTKVPLTTPTPVVNNIYGLAWKKQGKNLVAGVTWRNVSASINVASASQNDSGTYTCHLKNHSMALVNVHVLIAGENQAAVHHDTWNKGTLFWESSNFIIVSITPLLLIFA